MSKLERTFGMFAVSAALGLAACASDISYRNVDQPAGYVQEYGAPKNKTFQMNSELAKDVLRLTLYERSECDVLKVRVVHRTRETLEGGDVVHQEDLGRVQFTEGISGTIPCDETYARDVQVSLKVGDAVHRLGQTSALGKLDVNLSGALKQSLYGEDVPPTATVLVEWRGQGHVGQAEIGKLSLSELQKHEARVNELLGEFSTLLEKPPGEITPKEIARSYEIYEQLRQLNAGDARISGLQARFLELFYERKLLDRTRHFERNLEALNKAKAILSKAGPAIPLYVQLALSASDPQMPALHWARGQVVIAARTTSALCGGGFSWGGLGGYSPATQFALQYLRYAYGDGFASEVSTVCQHISGW